MDSNRHTTHNLLETRLPLQNSRGQTWNRKTAYQTWKLHHTCCLFASKPPQYDLHRLWRQPFGQHSNDHCGWFAKKKRHECFQDLTVYLQGKWGNTMHCLVLDRFVVFDPRITCPPPSHWVLFGVPMRLAFKFADEPHLEPESLRSECQLIYVAHLPNWFFMFQVCNGFNFRDVKTILFLLWSLFARGNGNITSMHGTNCSAWSTAQQKNLVLSDWARIIHSPLHEIKDLHLKFDFTFTHCDFKMSKRIKMAVFQRVKLKLTIWCWEVTCTLCRENDRAKAVWHLFLF